MADIEVVGLESLARLSRAMREAGEQGAGLKKQLRRELSAETKRTRADMRKAIAPALPQSGGLAADVLRSTRFVTQVPTSGGTAIAVRIRARGKRSIRSMNATGSFRHPVFGNRDVWVRQAPTVALKNFLDRPFEQSKPDVQKAVLEAITRVRSNIYGSI